MNIKMYYFFEADENGNRSYGQEYFVMSDSLENAIKAVTDCPEYKKSSTDFSKMGHTIHELNQVVQTELS